MSTPTEKSDDTAHDVSAVMGHRDPEKMVPAEETVAPVTPSESEHDKIDPHAERRLLLKLDLHVYPVLFVMYMMSFLDRINISNAKIQGMTADLDLVGNRFNICLFVYFISYILLEIPSNIIIKKVRPSLYLGTLMFCWGIINLSMGFIHNWRSLAALRFFLGVFEAGMLPGIIYLTSMYYRRHEFQVRMTFFFLSTLIGGAFGGLLAYAIASMGGDRGLAAWRWIFIIEGSITAFIGILGAFLTVDWPHQARFLSQDEKDLIKRRLALDGSEIAKMDVLNSQAYKLIFSDPKIWLGALIYMGTGTTGYAVTYFMPTILTEFGWAGREAQIRTIPVYIVAVVVMFFASWLSDKIKHRYGFIMAGCVIATIGYGILLNEEKLSRGPKFAAVFLINLGGQGAMPFGLAWLANNVSGYWKRSFSSAIQVMLGNCAGIIASNIFITSQAPKYPVGYGVGLAMLWMGGAAATAMYFYCMFENKARDEGKREHLLTELSQEEIDNLGDAHPHFRYTY